MKSLVKFFLITCFALGFVACSDDDADDKPTGPEIHGVSVAIEPVNGSYIENIQQVDFDPVTEVMEKVITVYSETAPDHDVEIMIDLDTTLINNEIDGVKYKKLSDARYEIKQKVTTIAKGTTQAQWVVEIKEFSADLWDATDKYALPLKIKELSQLADSKDEDNYFIFTFDLLARDSVLINAGTDRFLSLTTNPASGQDYTINVSTYEDARRDVTVKVEVPAMTEAALTDSIKMWKGNPDLTRTYKVLSSDYYTLSEEEVVIAEGTAPATGVDIQLDITEIPAELVDDPNYYWAIPVRIQEVSYGAKTGIYNYYYYVLDLAKTDIIYIGSKTPSERTFYVNDYQVSGSNLTATVKFPVGAKDEANQTTTVTVSVDPANLAAGYTMLNAAYYTIAPAPSPTDFDVVVNAGAPEGEEITVDITIPSDLFFNTANEVYALPFKITTINPTTGAMIDVTSDSYTLVLNPPADHRKFVELRRGTYVTVPFAGVDIPSQMTIETMVCFSFLSSAANNYVVVLPTTNSPNANSGGFWLAAGRASNGARFDVSVFGSNNYEYLNSTTANPLKTNVWYHVAVVIDKARTTLSDGTTSAPNGSIYGYINGMPTPDFAIKNDISAAKFNTTAGRIAIGSPGLTTSPSTSSRNRFSEFRIWKVARTEAEIRENMSTRIDAANANLMYYQPFTSLTTANEATASGLSGGRNQAPSNSTLFQGVVGPLATYVQEAATN